jgi:hypothetical protein
MTCPKCGATYNTLACPDCTERINRDASLRRQPPYLAKVVTGERKLILARKQQRKPHVQLDGDPARAFCGEPLESVTRVSADYNLMIIQTVCPQCAQVMADLMNTTVEML